MSSTLSSALLPTIGIEKIAVYPCSLSIDMEELVSARKGNVNEVCNNMMIRERSLNPPWEDPVTMGVNAAKDLLTPDITKKITFFLVGSESGLDQEKSLSTWMHRYLELPDTCRNAELKHACYAGTASLRLAASWLLTDPDPDARALIILTDESRAHFGKPYEFVMGAGAVAMIISKQANFFSLDFPLAGVYTHEVADLIRPTSKVEAGHSETSLLSYLDAADITFGRYNDSRLANNYSGISTTQELAECFPRQIYHSPFGGITQRAHKAIMRSFDDYDRAAVKTDFQNRVLPSLRFNQRMGGIYAASIFVSMVAAAASYTKNSDNTQCGIYSYGSGSCAEFFSGKFNSLTYAGEIANTLQEKLDARKKLDVEGYEEAESLRASVIDKGDYAVNLNACNNWYEQAYKGKNLLTFRGAADYIREYQWS